MSTYGLGFYILEMAGAEHPETMEAQSILQPLEEDVVDVANTPMPSKPDPILTDTEFMTMVRSKDWKLVHFLMKKRIFF